ncbi:MAG: Zn-dependent exopeptidase M28 [Anaerolineaceae bacterium]|nr:Zn-dependent exopeptidase M28 [Anaerolineaceae bacterium]
MRIIQTFSVIAIILATLVVPPNLDCQCGYDPLVADLLAQASQSRWVQWIAELSGAASIQTADGEGVITSRSSNILFEPGYKPSAFDYLIAELEKMGFIENTDFVIHTYDFPYSEKHQERNWKNLILTFPGEDPALKYERVLLVAHLDSMSDQETTLAPGADDNGTGAAGLLEAAYLLRNAHFARTINLIWFSGEEQSRRGSEYFVEDYADWLPQIQAVINLDMFGFDWDNDRCFEVHAGVLPGSEDIGECLASVIEAYDLDLRFDLIADSSAYTYSDHNAFWMNGIPAVMVIENFSYQADGVCGLTDRNYQYHLTTDLLTYINQDTGFSILKASLAALAQIAGPLKTAPELNPVTPELSAIENGQSSLISGWR